MNLMQHFLSLFGRQYIIVKSLTTAYVRRVHCLYDDVWVIHGCDITLLSNGEIPYYGNDTDKRTWIPLTRKVKKFYSPEPNGKTKNDKTEIKNIASQIWDNLNETELDELEKFAKFVISTERKRWPKLHHVINWLENGCDPQEAAKELRLYEKLLN